MTEPKKRVLLIDGDIVIYRACAALEFEMELDVLGGTVVTYHSDPEEIISHVECYIQELEERFDAEFSIFCWTGKMNWRKDVLPTYKSNRKGTRVPLHLYQTKLHFANSREYNPVMMEGLEADDVMGILATDPDFLPEYEKVIGSDDKDMKTIPTAVAKFADEEVTYVTYEDADKWWLTQTLAGDTTDGYSGAPSIGLKTAQEMLDEGVAFEKTIHTFKSGKRKGETEERWIKVPAQSLWHTVVSCFEKAGLTEAEAKVQATVARILRHCDFNKDGEIEIDYRSVKQPLCD